MAARLYANSVKEIEGYIIYTKSYMVQSDRICMVKRKRLGPPLHSMCLAFLLMVPNCCF